MRTYPYDAKNGWLFNASVFYQLKQKNIFKIGLEKQLDNGFHYYHSDNPRMKDETFSYTLTGWQLRFLTVSLSNNFNRTTFELLHAESLAGIAVHITRQRNERYQ